jgi:hypothetical protein
MWSSSEITLIYGSPTSMPGKSLFGLLKPMSSIAGIWPAILSADLPESSQASRCAAAPRKF